jgi:hypothetical protein
MTNSYISRVRHLGEQRKNENNNLREVMRRHCLQLRVDWHFKMTARMQAYKRSVVGGWLHAWIPSLLFFCLKNVWLSVHNRC